MALGEIAYLSPWLFVPLVIGLAAAWRKRRDERRLFLVCLALPPIVVFSLTPLWGARGLPHWTMPGWFFVFALAGAWVEDQGIADVTLRRWALASAGLLAAVAALASVQAATGWPMRLLPLRPGVADPTLEAFDWGGLRDAPRCVRRPPSSSRPNGRTRARLRSRWDPRFPSSSCRTIRAAGHSSPAEAIFAAATASSWRGRPTSRWPKPRRRRWRGPSARRSPSL